MRITESGFLVAAVVALAIAIVIPFVAASPDDDHIEGPTVDYTTAPPEVPSEAGTALLDGEEYDSVAAALDAATPGDRIVLDGVFEESVEVTEDDVTLVASEDGAVIDGQGDGHVLNVTGDDVQVESLWVRNSGSDTGNEDAGLFVAGDGVSLNDLHVSDVLWGVWLHGADDVTIEGSYIEGREEVQPLVERGNGIHLWETENTVIRDTTITDVRDGIYYSWASSAVTENTTMANSRYGVHFMYSDDNRLVNNTAVGNDVGYALMVSEDLVLVDNEAIHNKGTSGHGILVKDIDDSEIRENVLVENRNGLYVYNANGNAVVGNLVVHNDVGMVSTAGSERQHVVDNSFIDNEMPATSTATDSLEEWNGTERGNYWSSARPVDVSGDGISDVRYRPAGIVEHVTSEQPQAEVFADSPAFDAVRLAESSFPVIESPGIVDRKPLAEPAHDDWDELITGDSDEDNS